MQPGAGKFVRVRGHVWSVLARTRYGDCEAIRLRGVEAGNLGALRTFLSPFDRVAPVDRPAHWRRVRPRRWLHALRRAALEAHPFGGLRTADESRIRLLPYQLEPALALLRHGATRVLIADDVGLGKTIQAGLMLRELSVRSESFRAIVVMPAALREQWRDELRDRFNLESKVADAAWLALAARELPPEVNPWSIAGIYLTSFDFAKRPEVLRPLEDVTWDLAVLDEAHAAAPATDRLAAADAICSRARRVVLLTATPHGGDSSQYDALCRLGRLDGHQPVVMFQRARADAGAAVSRRTVLMTVRPSPAERRMHRLLERYASRIQHEGATIDPGATLAAIVLRKRALSSAGSLYASAARRQALLAGVVPAAEVQLVLPLGDEDPLPDAVADGTLAVPGLTDAAREQRALSAIVRAASAAAERETKTAFLVRFLHRVREPVIVFTEFRDTLGRLSAALEAAGFPAQLLHGGMSPEERADVQRVFNSSGRLLLATDAASEGLNLHHRCRIVVHYELPWSPVRLQQRTGRVDRIGQEKRVHEILLVAGDTAERLVLAPLARRVADASQATAASSRLFGALTESRIAAAMLSGEELTLPRPEPAPSGADTARAALRDEAMAELRRLMERRRWRSQSPDVGSPRPCAGLRLVSTLKRVRGDALGTSVVVVYSVMLRDADDQVVHAELVPVSVSGAQPEGTVKAYLERSLARRLGDIAGRHELLVAALDRRERAMATAVPAAARQLVQPGLFDRRAIRAAEGRRRAASAILADAAERVHALRASCQLTTSFEPVARLFVGAAERR